MSRCLWRDMMRWFFGTTARFLKYGFGFCLMNGSEICSEAYALAQGAGRYEIGPITWPTYRGRGCAYATCRYIAAECERRGHETLWSCDRDNAGSVAIAQKLGYKTKREYQTFRYPKLSSPR